MADDQKKGGFLSDLFAPVGGFGVTFATMFRKVATTEYPEVKRPTAQRFHGRHQLNRHPDGLEKCVGCELCAWACPADAILVEGAADFIAQRMVDLCTHPTEVDGALEPRHVDLRPFVFSVATDDLRVLPGGLTRVALDAGALVVNSSQNGGAKDTWVMP